MEEELDLSALSDEELVEQMHDDLYDGMADEVLEGTEILLSRGWSPAKGRWSSLSLPLQITTRIRSGFMAGSKTSGR